MTDDLTTHLRAAGQLLDDRAEGRVAAISGEGGDGATVYAIPSAPANQPRRGQVLLASAAVALVVVASVAALSWNRIDAPPAVATGDAIVALIPSAGVEGWDQLDIADTRPTNELFAPTGWVLVPTGLEGEEQRTSAVSLMVLPDEHRGSDGEPVSGAGLDGLVSEYDDQIHLETETIQVDSEPSMLVVLGRNGLYTVDDLFELAARFDPAVAASDQDFGSEWEVVARHHESAAGGTSRSFYLNNPIPQRYESTWMWSSTMTGVSDAQLWISGDPLRSRVVEVRGTTGWLVANDAFFMLTWLEAPGVLVQVSYGDTTYRDGAGADELEAELMALVNDLVPVDQAEWDRFAANALPQDPQGGATTTVLPDLLTDEIIIDDRELGGFRDQLGDGTWVRVYEHDDGGLCVRIYSGNETVCDADPEAAFGGEYAHLPRVHMTPDGTGGVMYGFLASGAVDLEIRAAGERGTMSLGWGTNERLWMALVPAGYEPTEVLYDNGSGEIDAYELPLQPFQR